MGVKKAIKNIKKIDKQNTLTEILNSGSKIELTHAQYEQYMAGYNKSIK